MSVHSARERRLRPALAQRAAGAQRQGGEAPAGPTVDDVRRLLAATDGNKEAETRHAAIVTVFHCLPL